MYQYIKKKTLLYCLLTFIIVLISQYSIFANSLDSNDKNIIKFDSANGYLFCLIDINDSINLNNNSIYFSFLKDIPKVLLKTKKYNKIKNIHTSLFYTNDSAIEHHYIENMRVNFISDAVASYGYKCLFNSRLIRLYLMNRNINFETLLNPVDYKSYVYTDSLLSLIFNYPVLFHYDYIYKKGIYFYFCKVNLNYIYLDFEDQITKFKSQFMMNNFSVKCKVNSLRRMYVNISSISSDSKLIIPYKIKVIKQFN